MKEEFLHYLWKYCLFYRNKLTDNQGNIIEVISPGEYNRDSGPDFFNARLKIAGTQWAGNVEIHIRSSDFEFHGHHLDPAYDNVILHVVALNDHHTVNSRGVEIPTAVIGYDPSIFNRYCELVNNPTVIACQPFIGSVDPLFIRSWLNALLIERLEGKSEHILKIFESTGNDWEETLYRLLSRYFGFRVNTEPFEMLAGSLPFRIIRKHSDNLLQVEALLFGTAGMLEVELFREAIQDEYYKILIREYKILSTKYRLKPIHGWLWKFARLRPANFPTLRISQLAQLLCISGGLFSHITEAGNISTLKSLFEVSATGYWADHYVFGKKSRRKIKNTGGQAADILLINAIIPLLFVYGKYRNSFEITDKAIGFLEEIEDEDNSIIREWKECGIAAENAFISQALIQLRNNYCRRRRCLECRIGLKLIGGGNKLKREDELLLDPDINNKREERKDKETK